VKKGSGILLTLASNGMEICWIYACTSFSMNVIMGRAVSFPATVGIIAFSAIISHFSRGRGWRVVNLIGIHLLGYVCAVLLVLYSFYYTSYPYLEKAWIVLLLTASRTPLEWLHLVLINIWVDLLWFGGVALAKREKTYVNICTRFDIGLAAFFVLLLIKLALRVKGGISADEQTSSVLIYPYLLLGLSSIGMARVGYEGSRHFLPGYGGFGILMSIVSFILLSASSLVFFLIPSLTQVAEIGRHVLKGAALWMLPVVTGVVRFMFMGGSVRPDPPSGSSPKGGEGSESLFVGSWWTELLEKIFRWGIEVMAVTFFALVIAVLIFFVLKWLFSRTAINPRASMNRDTSLSWFTYLRAFFAAFWGAVKNVTRGYSKAAELYSVLSEWSRRSGLPRLMTDTPLEFSARLIYQFPKLKAEIGSIIAAFNIETYGETSLTGEQFAGALLAWRTVRSPVHWPRRFKTRFINKMLAERQ
jgi:hypothetical protein